MRPFSRSVHLINMNVPILAALPLNLAFHGRAPTNIRIIARLSSSSLPRGGGIRKPPARVCVSQGTRGLPCWLFVLPDNDSGVDDGGDDQDDVETDLFPFVVCGCMCVCVCAC